MRCWLLFKVSVFHSSKVATNGCIVCFYEIKYMITTSAFVCCSKIVERSGSALECRTRNRESPGSNALRTVSKFGHFRSLHDAPVHSAV